MQKRIKKIKKLLENPQIRKILSRDNIIMIMTSLKIISQHLKDKKNKNRDYNIIATNSEKRQIKESLNYLLVIAINKSITPFLKELEETFSEISLWWNNNFVNDLEIEKIANSIKRFVNYHVSVLESIKVTKNLVDRMEKLRNFSPPSFDLSRAYLEILQDDYSKNRKDKRLKKKKK